MPQPAESKSQPIYILGGGLAGLSAGADLVRKGFPVVLLEAQPTLGGLAQSFTIDGYTCDLGPHRFHSNRKEIVDHMKDALDGNVHDRVRMSRIFMFGKFIDYPLRAGNVIRSLPFHVLVLSMLDYWVMRVRVLFSPIPDDSFRNYVRKRFGNTLYRLFFGTYTEKAWQIPASQISPDWAGQRITLLNLWDVVKKTLFRPRNVPRTLVSKFVYPKKGGVGSIAEGYARIIREHGGTIVTNARVQKFTLRDGRVVSISYEHDAKSVEVPVDRVVSTIPINRMIESFDPAPPAEILQAAKDLKHKAILFVYLMLDRPQVTPDHWVYLPEPKLTVHRISEFKNFAESSCPEGKTLVCAEITCNQNDERWRKSDQELTDLAVTDLTTIGIIRKEDLIESVVRRVPYAYPLYDLAYRANLQTLLVYLRKVKNLITTGRQGMFRYGNMDHSIAMGTRVARTISTGEGPDHGDIGTEQESFD